MVLENLTDFQRIKKNLGNSFVFGFFVNTISLITATMIFEPAAGLVSLFLTSSAAFPLLNKAFEVEENQDVYGNKNFLDRHSDVLKIYSGFFIGVLISTSMIYFALESKQAEELFKFQISAITPIHTNQVTGKIFNTEIFNKILSNNLRVSVVSFLLSVVFGAAAIFLITWNSSVVAVFIGSMAKTTVGVFGAIGLLGTPLAFIYGFFTASGSLMLHGIPELMSYFVSGLAGGIISVGISKENLNSGHFRKVFLDGVLLLLLSFLLIFMAAAIETNNF